MFTGMIIGIYGIMTISSNIFVCIENNDYLRTVNSDIEEYK